MPTIDVAMRRSVRRSVGDLVIDSLLRRQTAVGDGINSVKNGVSDVKTTFSSWDNCMAKTYCKWPVIAAITIGGLIVFSVLWCVVRCCCCGMSCCCTCFSFLKCCDCCGGLCDGKKNKPMKHLDDPFTAHHAGAASGYRPPAAMPAIGGGYGSKPEPPQYAQFDVGRNGLAVDPKPLSEDALPPMPSWETAQKKHVAEDTPKDAVELGELDPATGQKVPLMAGGAAGGSSMPPSPNELNNNTPYGARDGQGGQNGYMAAGVNDPYGQRQNNFNHNTGYGAQTNGVAGGHVSPSPRDNYGENNNFVAGAGPGYGMQRQNTGGYSDSGNSQYPPQVGRQYTGNSTRPMDRQYPDQSNFNNQPPRGPSRGPGTPVNYNSPPYNNNSGFEFNDNQSYSRPGYSNQQSYNSSRRQSPPDNGHYDNSSTGSYGNRNSPPQGPQYSNYQSYDSQPSSQHRRDPTALRPGGGRDRRPPQGWDPVNNPY